MDPASVTDDIIQVLLTCPKLIQSKRPRSTPKARHTEFNLDVKSTDGLYTFTLIIRQSTMVADSYSCGLVWHATPSHKLTLTRYNGSDHEHNNPLEGFAFDGACHIHRATERYITTGRKAEHYAEQTTRYNDVKEALACLLDDCNINWPTQSSDLTDNQISLDF
jgi:hypothetical protein